MPTSSVALAEREHRRPTLKSSNTPLFAFRRLEIAALEADFEDESSSMRLKRVSVEVPKGVEDLKICSPTVQQCHTCSTKGKSHAHKWSPEAACAILRFSFVKHS
ncbi:hypothetical protein SISSUDRAFT_1066564 [Sistotremastrum suecicum HHB10207 ss-3]|uniref:Uncharacterized protein n=1 Tax=Sistotremastrum suecicum HHB10207 ss-3 TaxID=1314776 RepID=A0A165Y5T2_9AGAM|nr:hypothetical protein SISSUDRAFT_1066564 [Sistotremastrum suecicum HHB10207 ss-3]